MVANPVQTATQSARLTTVWFVLEGRRLHDEEISLRRSKQLEEEMVKRHGLKPVKPAQGNMPAQYRDSDVREGWDRIVNGSPGIPIDDPIGSPAKRPPEAAKQAGPSDEEPGTPDEDAADSPQQDSPDTQRARVEQVARKLGGVTSWQVNARLDIPKRSDLGNLITKVKKKGGEIQRVERCGIYAHQVVEACNASRQSPYATKGPWPAHITDTAKPKTPATTTKAGSLRTAWDFLDGKKLRGTSVTRGEAADLEKEMRKYYHLVPVGNSNPALYSHRELSRAWHELEHEDW